MCNCKQLAETVVDLNAGLMGQALPSCGQDLFPCYFGEIESEDFEPQLNYGDLYYCCKECGQAWYFECAPDEITSPVFAIKRYSVEQRLSKDEVNAKKEFITLLAHNGFSDKKCSHIECDNYQLNGKKMCHKHLSIL